MFSEIDSEDFNMLDFWRHALATAVCSELLAKQMKYAAPEEAFHLILCRNVAFTYFDDELQRRTLRRIEDRLLPGGALVIGSAESLPAGATGVEPWSAKLRVYRRSERARPGLAR